MFGALIFGLEKAFILPTYFSIGEINVERAA